MKALGEKNDEKKHLTQNRLSFLSFSCSWICSAPCLLLLLQSLPQVRRVRLWHYERRKKKNTYNFTLGTNMNKAIMFSHHMNNLKNINKNFHPTMRLSLEDIILYFI